MTQKIGRESLRSIWTKVPLLGYLSYCTRKNHVETIKELFITLVFSTATFWISALLFEAFLINRDASFVDLLYKTANAGQLFIFAVTFLGPVFIIAGDDPAKAKTFPNRGLHLVLLFLLAVVGSSFYAIQLAAREFPGGVQLNSNFLFRASVVIAIFSIALRYLAVVYRKNTLVFDPEAELVEPAHDFAAEFAKRNRE
jgi:hypothetical protein